MSLHLEVQVTLYLRPDQCGHKINLIKLAAVKQEELTGTLIDLTAGFFSEAIGTGFYKAGRLLT